MKNMEGQLDFFDLTKTPLEKAETYEDIMAAIGDECVLCAYDVRGICCCMKECVLGNMFKKIELNCGFTQKIQENLQSHTKLNYMFIRNIAEMDMQEH